MRFWPIVLVACTHAESAPTTAPPVATVAAPMPFADEIHSVFPGYRVWGRVDDEVRWAPDLCRMANPASAHVSRVEEGPHQQKLYSLFASDRDAYSTGAVQPGFVIVKESYVPERVEKPDPMRYPWPADADGLDHFYPFAQGADGSTYKASKFAGAYVMMKLAKGTPDTDEGWVYGTIDASGQLTSSGRVASCMGCHDTKPERLFTVVKQ